MNNTKIAWTQKTWNPVTGCSKYSAGCVNCYAEVMTRRFKFDYYFSKNVYTPRNCWLGVTVENQKAKSRIEKLHSMMAASVRFLSCEPLIEDLGELNLDNIDWVIVGGETGPKARPMKKEWVLSIKLQCAEQNVPFFFKSWGRYGEDGKPCPKDQHDLLDGMKYQAYPKGWEKGV